MKSIASEQVRHLIVRADADDVLPDALTRELREQRVACGWIRASGVLTAVEMRAFDAELGGPAIARRLQGQVHVVALEGSIGMSGNELSVGMRAIVARETDRGLETFAGEIVTARVVALEAVVTAYDDVLLARALDRDAGVWLLGAPNAVPPVAFTEPPPSSSRAVDAAAEASTNHTPPAVANNAAKKIAPPVSALTAAVIPPRPTRPHSDEEQIIPEAGDIVEHFAFGRCEVVKTDGDRLHLKMPRDGRIKEIALEMLRVSPLASEGDKKHFKLERKM
jgi:predicted DNA-binding protein with PD1-like motif